MTKLRVRICADGRVGFPHVFEYQYRSGARICVPPGPEVPYTIVIHDHEAYQELKLNGWLTSEEHCGPRLPLVDNRNTS